MPRVHYQFAAVASSYMRPVLAVLVVLALAALAVAATAATTPRKVPASAVNVAPRATADPSNTARVDLGHPMGSSTGQGRGISPVVRGLLIPIEDAEIPTAPELLPNSPREHLAGRPQRANPARAGTRASTSPLTAAPWCERHRRERSCAWTATSSIGTLRRWRLPSRPRSSSDTRRMRRSTTFADARSGSITAGRS